MSCGLDFTIRSRPGFLSRERIPPVKEKDSRPNLPDTTSSGIPIHPFYGDPPPGEFPFTRGISPQMYRSRFWTMRQYAGFASAREANRRYRYLLDQGQPRLSVAFDLLKEYIARGTYIFPPRASLKITTDIFAFCGRELPRWNTISISGYHIREAGSTAVQEVAFTLSNAIAYVEAALGRGLAIDEFAPRLSFFFNA